MQNFLYQELASQLAEQIQTGLRLPGDRMPSIRQLAQQLQHSKATIIHAYELLEAQGLIEARARSGFVVSATGQTASAKLSKPLPSEPDIAPSLVSANQVLLDIMEQGAAFDIVPEQDKQPANDLLRRTMARAYRHSNNLQQDYYEQPLGYLPLRQQLAKRLAFSGAQVEAKQVLITQGCQHALLLALMACTKAGDVVAIESPGFYGAFQLLETLGLQALELPSSADTGISPQALSLALEHWSVKALLVSPAFATPTGSCMPEDHKTAIVALCQQHGVTIIEDDIYAELQFGLQRPRSLYSYDDSGNTILCSSFSKSLSRDLRIGWIVPGKYLAQVKRLKIVTSLASSQVQQQGLSDFIQQGGLDKHLRQKRLLLAKQQQELQALVAKHLPMVKSCSVPSGGLSVWLEFDETIDTIKLYNQAKREGIVITPGRLFTAQEKYQNFIRLSFLQAWDESRQQALIKLAKLLSA